MATPSLSTMSMTITPQSSSDSSVSGATVVHARESSDFPNLKLSLSDLVSEVATDTTLAALPRVQSGGRNQQPGAARKQGEDKKFLSYEDILIRKNEGEALIVVDGHAYDVTESLDSHPGGAEVILGHWRWDDVKDAGELMRGKVEEDGHTHSKAAFRMLEQFFIGSVKAASGAPQSEARDPKKYRYTVDSSKPIVSQVGRLGPDYQQWVHDPIISKETPRFFESDLSEFFTRTKWWVIPLVWVPVAMILFYISLAIEKVPLYMLPGNCAVGIFIWTLEEYLLHRFLFHMKTSSYWGNTMHYILHGFHHKYPMDGARLVFPPAFTLVILIATWFITGSWVAHYPNKLSVFGGGLLAYVAYDLTHYFLHFGTAFNNESRKMKRYHLNHHFKDQSNGYGITSRVWDCIFGTRPTNKIAAD